jgi:hypothetical protein
MNYIQQLNPSLKLDIYRIALGFIKNRLKWDLSPKSRSNYVALKRLKNQYAGKKAIILCNGPSLNDVDFNELKMAGIFTIGLNKINLLFNKTDFRPNLIISVNKLVIEQNKDFFNHCDIPLILDSSASNIVKNRSNVNYIHSLPFQLRFAGDISGSVCQGYTVTYVALQIAFHLGFTNVAIVGCDHNFVTEGSANMTVTSGKTDPNHFSSEYFSNGMNWQLPDLLGSEIHYKLAREYFEANNRKIVNCTQGGKLEVYPRMDLKDFING